MGRWTQPTATMLIAAARTIILQTLPAHGAQHVSYPTWLFRTVVPLWFGVRLAARTWSTAWTWGRRRRS